MPDYAVHDGTTVTNVVVAESADVAEQVTGLYVIETNGVPWTGWSLIEGVWAPPSPFPSWTLDPATALWVAPVPVPETEGMWSWDEDTLTWVDVSET